MLLTFFAGMYYGYFRGIDDTLPAMRYVEMASNYVHLRIAEEKGEQELRTFLYDDLSATVELHRLALEDRSTLSRFFIRDFDEVFFTNRSEYYNAISEYVAQKGDQDSQLEENINWLRSTID